MKFFWIVFLSFFISGCQKEKATHYISCKVYRGYLAGESFEYEALIKDYVHTDNQDLRLIQLKSEDHPDFYFLGYDLGMDDSVEKMFEVRRVHGEEEFFPVRIDYALRVSNSNQELTLHELADAYTLMCRAIREFVNEEHLILESTWDKFKEKLVTKPH